MKIAELIKELSKFPQDTTVKIGAEEGTVDVSEVQHYEYVETEDMGYILGSPEDSEYESAPAVVIW